MLPGPPDIDRIAPTLLPGGRSVMRHRWADLLFLHWPVPAEMLIRRLPVGLDVDMFEGVAYIGLVPFTMTGIRPWWGPAVPWLSNFHEVNVRTYVHRRNREPGVFFFSLDAAQPIAVKIARRFWHLAYHYARMSLKHGADGSVEYRSERRWPGPLPAQCSVTYRPQGSPQPARPGTLEHFLVERYILYADSPSGLKMGRVHHSPYPLQTAVVDSLEESLIAAADIDRPGGPPLAHYASEVRVKVYPLSSVR